MAIAIFELSKDSEALEQEALAWGCIFSDPRDSDSKYVDLRGWHFLLALLTCEGPGKSFLEKFGITLETREGGEGEALYSSQARMELYRLSEARERAKLVQEGAFSEYLPLIEEAARMGSRTIEPVHYILALMKKGRYLYLSVSYDTLCEILGSSGEIKPESLQRLLAAARAKKEDLERRQAELSSAIQGFQPLLKALRLLEMDLSSTEERHKAEARKAEALEKLVRRVSPEVSQEAKTK